MLEQRLPWWFSLPMGFSKLATNTEVGRGFSSLNYVPVLLAYLSDSPFPSTVPLQQYTNMVRHFIWQQGFFFAEEYKLNTD